MLKRPASQKLGDETTAFRYLTHCFFLKFRCKSWCAHTLLVRSIYRVGTAYFSNYFKFFYSLWDFLYEHTYQWQLSSLNYRLVYAYSIC